MTADAAAGAVEPVELTAGGFTFRGLAAGPADGELVLLLHGWPQTSAGWRPQLQALGEAGYRAVAPDQRGYSPGARPRERTAYRIEALVGDVLAMADELGAERFSVVGHDWGGVVTWALAAGHASRVRTAAVLSTPHPKAFAESMLRSLQPALSSYVLLFRTPRVPEALFLARGGGVLKRMLTSSGLPAPIADEYVAAMREPGALTAAFNWYRAFRPGDAGRIGRVSVPTMYVWSDRDVALGRTAAERTERYVDGPYRFVELNGVGHWLAEERPDTVSELLLQHLGPHVLSE